MARVTVAVILGVSALFAAGTFVIAVGLLARVADRAPPDLPRLTLHLMGAVLLVALGLYNILYPEKTQEQAIENSRRLGRVPVLGMFWGGWIDDDLAWSGLFRWMVRVGGIGALGAALTLIGLMWR